MKRWREYSSSDWEGRKVHRENSDCLSSLLRWWQSVVGHVSRRGSLTDTDKAARGVINKWRFSPRSNRTLVRAFPVSSHQLLALSLSSLVWSCLDQFVCSYKSSNPEPTSRLFTRSFYATMQRKFSLYENKVCRYFISIRWLFRHDSLIALLGKKIIINILIYLIPLF